MRRPPSIRDRAKERRAARLALFSFAVSHAKVGQAHPHRKRPTVRRRFRGFAPPGALPEPGFSAAPNVSEARYFAAFFPAPRKTLIFNSKPMAIHSHSIVAESLGIG
jgi:hypothetical protein